MGVKRCATRPGDVNAREAAPYSDSAGCGIFSSGPHSLALDIIRRYTSGERASGPGFSSTGPGYSASSCPVRGQLDAQHLGELPP